MDKKILAAIAAYNLEWQFFKFKITANLHMAFKHKLEMRQNQELTLSDVACELNPSSDRQELDEQKIGCFESYKESVKPPGNVENMKNLFVDIVSNVESFEAKKSSVGNLSESEKNQDAKFNPKTGAETPTGNLWLHFMVLFNRMSNVKSFWNVEFKKWLFGLTLQVCRSLQMMEAYPDATIDTRNFLKRKRDEGGGMYF